MSANTSLTLSLPGNRLVGAAGGSNDKPEGVIMRLYESVLIARQDITTAQVETMADEFAEIITSAGGSIKKREYWGLRALAYRIKKNRKGHYVMFNLETGPEALKEYERIMGLNEDVLRFLNIRIEEVEEGPSIMMQAKTERPTRGGRDDRDDHGETKVDESSSREGVGYVCFGCQGAETAQNRTQAIRDEYGDDVTRSRRGSSRRWRRWWRRRRDVHRSPSRRRGR